MPNAWEAHLAELQQLDSQELIFPARFIIYYSIFTVLLLVLFFFQKMHYNAVNFVFFVSSIVV